MSFKCVLFVIDVMQEEVMKLSRRHFIRVSGATLALPYFESIAAKSGSEKPSKKLVFVYVPNGIVRRGFFPGEQDRDLPGFVGGFNADKIKKKRLVNRPGVYKLDWTPTMRVLEEKHSKDITMVTGMDRTFKNGQDVHAQGSMAYLTSVSPQQAGSKGWRFPNGRTLDHIVGDVVGGSTAFKTLEISCNGFKSGKEPPHFDNISWYDEGQVAPSIKDPKILYDRLFKGGSYGTHVADVTDLVLADAKTLARKMGKADRVKFAMIAALQMGMTNVATFMIGPERWQAPMLYESIWDKPVVHHSMTHNQKGNGWKELMKIDLFHMQKYDYILTKMKEMKEADGSSMLDNSIVTYGACMGDGATHQYFDLPFLLAGKAQGQIKQGRLVRCKSGTLNSNMWLTLAQMMGCEMDSYADSTSTISLG
jgi:hypothetical protein